MGRPSLGPFLRVHLSGTPASVPPRVDVGSPRGGSLREREREGCKHFVAGVVVVSPQQQQQLLLLYQLHHSQFRRAACSRSSRSSPRSPFLGLPPPPPHCVSVSGPNAAAAGKRRRRGKMWIKAKEEGSGKKSGKTLAHNGRADTLLEKDSLRKR